MTDIIAEHRLDRELEARARGAGETLYRQWLKDELSYGGGAGSFWYMPPNGAPDRTIQYLSHRDWDITVNTDDDGHIVSYAVARKEER
jgi:hypothetical protein